MQRARALCADCNLARVIGRHEGVYCPVYDAFMGTRETLNGQRPLGPVALDDCIHFRNRQGIREAPSANANL